MYRAREDSITSQKLSVEKQFRKFIKVIIESIDKIDVFMKKIPFFVQNPEYRYLAIDTFVQGSLSFGDVSGLYSKMPPYKIDELLQKEFSDYFSEHIPFISYMFDALNVYRLKLIHQQQKTAHLQRQILEMQKKLN